MNMDCEKEKKMGSYNLLDEPWIAVLNEKNGEKREISMLEFFRNAGEYRSLAGEMETQNFAVMRFLLAVIQTVFSRFDLQGNVLPGIILNDRWVQTEPVDQDDLEDYCSCTDECWKQLYMGNAFPNIIIDYLERWRDRFNLFDEEHPFYQVNKKEMDEIMTKIPKKKQPTSFYGKNLNRTISESENKEALFSPVVNGGNEKRGNKDIMTAAELARWLLTFQGYSGLADKVSLTSEGQRPSKGWLFDLGGIYLQGNTIYETLVMNYLPESPVDNKSLAGRVQRPCWEVRGSEMVDGLCQGASIDNLAELYTNWSRAVYIDPKLDIGKPLEIKAVKLPEIDHTEHCIEPMTLWKYNDNGSNKDHFTPKKHAAGQSLWRSFGIIAMKSSADEGFKQHQPGIFRQYERLASTAGSRWTDLTGISMEDDGNATSWLPVDEISDSLQINDLVITDRDSDGWVIRINDTVETTKEVVSVIYRGFLRGICEIRNLKLKPMDSLAEGFIKEETEKIYAEIDIAFKDWLISINPDDSKEEKVRQWYDQLKKMVLRQGEELFENSTVRDLTGIEKDNATENIATKYWQFVSRVNKKLV